MENASFYNAGKKLGIEQLTESCSVSYTSRNRLRNRSRYQLREIVR